MKMLKLLFLLLVCQISLFAQKSIDSEEQLLQALFLDIPIEAEVSEIITHINTRDDFVKDSNLVNFAHWKVAKHPFIRLEPSEVFCTLAEDSLDWDVAPKVGIEIYPEQQKQTYAILKKEYKRLQKRIKKEFQQVNKEKIGFSFIISKGESITYRSKNPSNLNYLKLGWVLGNCKRTYRLNIEYWGNISNQQRIYSERSNVPKK